MVGSAFLVQIIMETMERHALWFTLSADFPTGSPLPAHAVGSPYPAGEYPVPGCELGAGQPAVRSGLTLGRGAWLEVLLSFHLQIISPALPVLAAGLCESKPFQVWPEICPELRDCSLLAIQNEAALGGLVDE